MRIINEWVNQKTCKRGKKQGATSAQAKKGRSPQTKRKAAAKKAGTTKKRPTRKR